MLKYIYLEKDGNLSDEDIETKITEKTKIVAVTQVSNVLGLKNDVKKIVKKAHSVGAVAVVDGSQSVAHMKVDVRDLDCDFFAFSGHKMLSPMGIGVLYGKYDILDAMPPFLRGGDMFWVFYSYNPPRSARNWVNKEARDLEAHPGEDGRFICHTTYLDVIDEHPEWISAAALAEAERSRRKTPESYRWQWLGEVIGTGSEVFPDKLLDIRPITDEERASISLRSFGVDAGSVHPWVFMEAGYDENERVLYLLDEESRQGTEAIDVKTAELVAAKLQAAEDPAADVWCDSAARGMILYYQEQGIGAQKSLKQGLNAPKSRIRWMQNLTRIVIDPDRCPLAAKEFPEFEYVSNGQGDITETLPKVNDDAIDAAGYAAGLWIRSNL